MAGIYPDGGVAANTTLNAVDVPTVNCATELFYSTNRCTPRFEPAAMNALISEILNASTAFGTPYNCGILTNLRGALQTVNNWCDRPINVPVGDLSDDFLLACLAGVQSRMPITALLSAAGPCTYPDVAVPDLDDLLAGCFDGASGKTPISALLQLIIDNLPGGGAGAPTYRTGDNIPFPQNGGNDTNIFSIADCDGLLFSNPWMMNIASVGGASVNLMGFQPGGYAAVSNVQLTDTGSGGGYSMSYQGAVTMEKLSDGQWYIFSGTRVIMRNIPIADETQVYATRNEVTSLSPSSSLTKLHKFPV